jgi:DNA-binding response OmpR family regulator
MPPDEDCIDLCRRMRTRSEVLVAIVSAKGRKFSARRVAGREAIR